MDCGLNRHDFTKFQIDSKDLIAALLPSRAGMRLSRWLAGNCPNAFRPKEEVEMKRWLCQGTLTAAIALSALSGAAWAGGSDDFGCSNATLKGLYSFGVTNYTPAPPRAPNPPITTKVVTGIKVFDGNGNLTQRDYQGDNLAGPDFSPPGRETGTYQVDSDCTGSMVIYLKLFGVPPVPTQGGAIWIRFVISNSGRHIHEVVSENTPPGAAGPFHPTQTSADDWKVASGQDR